MNNYFVWKLLKVASFLISAFILWQIKLVVFIPSQIGFLADRALFKMDRW